MIIKEYRKVENLEEAWELNQKKSNRIIGGMLWMKMNRRPIQTAIDLSGLGLDKIEETDQEFRIGCMASLSEIERHPGLHTYTHGAVKEALRSIVGVQFRNLATVGGSIYGRYGFSDVLTVFLVMDSFVELYKGGIIPLSDYTNMPYDNDILVRLIIKKHQDVRYSYQSVRNSRTDFPVLTCAAAFHKDGTSQYAVGARPGRAVLVSDSGQVVTGSNLRGSAEYRKHLVKVLMKRASDAKTQ